MNETAFSIWVYLSRTPLLWLAATIGFYFAADYLTRHTKYRAIFHPGVLSALILCLILLGTGTPYETYFEGAQFVHFLLGPATVALGIPLYENRQIIRHSLLPIVAALIVGATVAAAAALAVASFLGAPDNLLISLAPKSITTPVAMGISQKLGGDATLTAVIVMCTAISGIMIVGPIMNLLHIRDKRARGLAVGITCHGMGTAFSLSESAVAGSFSGIGMGMCSLVTAIVVPIMLKLMHVV